MEYAIATSVHRSVDFTPLLERKIVRPADALNGRPQMDITRITACILLGCPPPGLFFLAEGLPTIRLSQPPRSWRSPCEARLLTYST